MDLSIIIVNWNSKDYLQSCIDSIKSETNDLDYEIIIIDGGSYDGCKEMIDILYPEIKFIQSKNNVGFAKANNIASKKANGRNILFLNPDTIVRDKAIEKLIYMLEYEPGAGIVGPRILNCDGTIQTSCVRAFPNILNQIFDAEILMKSVLGFRLHNTAPLFMQHDKAIKVDAVSGACLMIRKAIFDKVKMFSEEYFMYSEDIDLCYKVKMAEMQIYYVPEAVVIHHGGGSSSKSSINAFSEVMMLESRWRFFKKTRSSRYCRQYRVVMLFASIVRIWLLILVWPIYRLRKKDSIIEKSLRKWIARLRWILGVAKWVQSY